MKSVSEEVGDKFCNKVVKSEAVVVDVPNNCAGLAGVNNASMALLRSALVALMSSPKDKASCRCCSGVRPETRPVSEEAAADV